MALISLFLSLTTILLSIYYFYKVSRKNKDPKYFFNVPYGPRAWPLVGNLLQLGLKPYQTLYKWSNTYGPIFRIYLGSQEVVVLNGTSIIREALQNSAEEFAGRPELYMIHATLKGKGIISSPYNKDYDEHKKFLINSFSRFARRRSSLEITCLESVSDILNEYRERLDDTFVSSSEQIKNKLSQIASQNVLTITFGSRMDDKHKFSKLVDLITANFKNTSVAAAYNFFPLARIFKSSILKNVMKCSEFLNSLVSQRMENFDPNGVHNITDAYLTELLQNMGLTQEFKPNQNISTLSKSRGRYKSFSFDHLSSMVQDLFVAGTETISNTLNWSIIYVTYFQDCQRKVHEEIDRTLGREKFPCELDRARMHYVEAFINETLRFHCAGPILIPRSTTSPTKLRGYFLPENTFVMVNMWSCMRDEDYWEEPDKFNPDRFLDENGCFRCDNPAMMPFSIGKRACTGENLARLQLFLIFTSLLQKYKFEFANDDVRKDEHLLDGIPGISLCPPNVPLKLQLR